jgi:hypothetical protein
MKRRPLFLPDGRALLAALTARDEGLVGTYLDLQEGGLLRVYDPELVGRSNEAVEDRLDAEPDRYARVPLYTREYRLMAEFIDQVDDQLARLLDAALAGREAFRRFEAVLAGWPEEQRRWEIFREQALIRWVVTWLRSLGVEPRWDLAVPPEESPDPPWLLRVALREGRAGPRRVHCDSEKEAVRLFVRLVQELCELWREPVRTRGLRAQIRFSRGGIEVRREGRVVTLHMTQRA